MSQREFAPPFVIGMVFVTALLIGALAGMTEGQFASAISVVGYAVAGLMLIVGLTRVVLGRRRVSVR